MEFPQFSGKIRILWCLCCGHEPVGTHFKLLFKLKGGGARGQGHGGASRLKQASVQRNPVRTVPAGR